MKTGDFVEAMLRDARDVNEYAFAIGALCHYASDNEGHAIAVNRAVPLMYPKLRRKYGDTVPYENAPKEHVLVEFAFDVLLVANGGYKLQAYHDFIGFKVAKPLLERAFSENLRAGDEGALPQRGSGRSAPIAARSGPTIPNMTKVAWEKKQEQIQKTTPGAVREQFVLTLPRTAYEQEYGKDYRKPSVFARLIGVLYAILPKIGPLRPLAFKVPTPDAERLFLESLRRTRERFGVALRSLPTGDLRLPNVNMDTGKPVVPGQYPLADETLRDLQKHLGTATRLPASSRARSR